MKIHERFTNFAQLKESERLGGQQKAVKVGLWLMIIANLVFTGAYGWFYAVPAEAGVGARLFSTVIHLLFVDVATIIWMVATTSSDSEAQRWLAEVMHHLGLVLSTMASIVFAYLAFGGDLVPAEYVGTIQAVGFYTMLVAAGGQFISAYLYQRFSPEHKLAQDRAQVRRIQKANSVAFQADLAIDTENARGDLMSPYRPLLIEQEARRQTEEALLDFGYSPEDVKRALPALPRSIKDEVNAMSGLAGKMDWTTLPSKNGHGHPAPAGPATNEADTPNS